jgi:hypothetical protein
MDRESSILVVLFGKSNDALMELLKRVLAPVIIKVNTQVFSAECDLANPIFRHN